MFNFILLSLDYFSKQNIDKNNIRKSSKYFNTLKKHMIKYKLLFFYDLFFIRQLKLETLNNIFLKKFLVFYNFFNDIIYNLENIIEFYNMKVKKKKVKIQRAIHVNKKSKESYQIRKYLLQKVYYIFLEYTVDSLMFKFLDKLLEKIYLKIILTKVNIISFYIYIINIYLFQLYYWNWKKNEKKYA